MRLDPHPQFFSTLKSLKQELLLVLKDLKFPPLRVAFCGSCERKTVLRKGKKDLDVFLYYQQVDFPEIKAFHQQINKWSPCVLVHSGFPYLRTKVQRDRYTIHLDLVFCGVELDCEQDRTQVHHLYVSSRLNEEKRLQILRLKRLLKKHNLYGAQSSIQGFSGFCVECLILKYEKISLIPNDLKELSDPVDPQRNLLDSVSKTNLLKFQVLKVNQFKGPPFKKVPNLYYLQNPPLSLWRTFDNNPHVVSVVYTKKVLLAHLCDRYVPLKMDLDNPVWNLKSPDLYLSKKTPVKRISFQKFVEQYGLLPVEQSPFATEYFKTYSFLK